MVEITADNALGFLRENNWIDSGPAQVEVLSGGVSNQVLRVTQGCQRFVLKQSRPQLRTKDAWFSDLERIWREQEVMQFLEPLLPPGTVPHVLFADRDNYVFGMAQAPADAQPWKSLLLEGIIDLDLGEHIGSVLGQMHERSAWDAGVKAFADQTVFVQLRVDPFYRTIQRRRQEVAAAVGELIDDMRCRKEALCHGDYTPKNILVPPVVAGDDGGKRFTLVDYETAHLGDPAMDLGLFLAHLLMKSVRDQEHREDFVELTRRFWQGYARVVSFRPLPELECRAIGHCGACLLARIDGTSPVDYLPDEPRRDAVRSLGRHLLLHRPPTWESVLA
jgi:aminoglycoside phosphotransferase (APT) family kinase protein